METLFMLCCNACVQFCAQKKTIKQILGNCDERFQRTEKERERKKNSDKFIKRMRFLCFLVIVQKTTSLYKSVECCINEQ